MEKFLRLAPDLLVALLLWLLLLPRWRQRGARHAVMCTIFYLYLCGVAYFTLETREEAAAILDRIRTHAPFEGDFTRGLYFKGTN